MAVRLEHPFTTDKPLDESWATILDLERVVPCVEGGSVLERTGPESAKAQILVKMGAMSMKMVGTVEQPSAATGTVMRAETLRYYAEEAGFRGVDVLPVEHDFFRFYHLIP